MKKHVIIFSHGFGVRKDDRGLFPDIIKALPDTECVMFDYSHFDEATNTTVATTLSDQAELLRQQVTMAKTNNPDAIIDLVCHSQGCIIAALAQAESIRKTIFLAPPDQRFGGTGRMEEKINTMLQLPGAIMDADGSLHYPRRDGSTTIIPQSYWQSRQEVDAIKIYKELALKTELTIIQSLEDEIIGLTDFSELPETVEIIQMNTGHDFKDEARNEVALNVAKLLEVEG
jgi:hypothetical protein